MERGPGAEPLGRKPAGFRLHEKTRYLPRPPCCSTTSHPLVAATPRCGLPLFGADTVDHDVELDECIGRIRRKPHDVLARAVATRTFCQVRSNKSRCASLHLQNISP